MSGEGEMGGVSGQKVIDDSRHLDSNKGPKGMVKFLCFGSQTGCCGPNQEVPINLVIYNHCFCIYLPYSLGEVISSKEVVLVIPRLQIRFLY